MGRDDRVGEVVVHPVVLHQLLDEVGEFVLNERECGVKWSGVEDEVAVHHDVVVELVGAEVVDLGVLGLHLVVDSASLVATFPDLLVLFAARGLMSLFLLATIVLDLHS